MANNITRFRAYQLGTAGSSFSYCVDNVFVLIEGRYNDVNKPNIMQEMAYCGCKYIDRLHITSWDKDHCNPSELDALLNELMPTTIECPGYNPDTDCAKDSLKIIKEYVNRLSVASEYSFTPETINKLTVAEERKYSDVIFNPLSISEKHNDNSTVKLFRRGRFCVLSLGDCESPEISKRIANDSIACNETDVMILAHHGADNGFTTQNLLQSVMPKIAVCTSNYDNQYEHPDQNIRTLLHANNIPLYTTKTGDVLIVCGIDNTCVVYNLAGNNTTISSKSLFKPKLSVPNE